MKKFWKCQICSLVSGLGAIIALIIGFWTVPMTTNEHISMSHVKCVGIFVVGFTIVALYFSIRSNKYSEFVILE